MLCKISLILLVTSTSCVLSQYNDEYQQQQEPQQPARGGGGGGYQQQEGVQENEGSAGGGNGIEPLDPSIPEPPSQIPETSFVCDGKPYDPGMYADEETNCRVYHMCYRGKKDSFICGTGTIFNQEILSCDYPDNVDCAQSQSFYSANTELGKSSPEPAPGGGGGQTPSQQRPRPSARPSPGAQTPDTSYGGAQDASGDAGQDGYDQAPAPAPRPQQRPRPQQGGKVSPPVARPPPPAPSTPQQPSYGGGAAAARPAVRPQKTNPRPRPAAQKPRPAPQQPQRPIVQSNQELSLDYEPSSQVIQRRSSRQLEAPAMTRRNPSKRWQMYSEDSS